MASWKIEVNGKGLRKTSVEKLVKKLQDELDGATVSVTDNSPPESRSDRFSVAQSLVDEAKSEFECLRDELQDWYDNLPENFQSGDKGQELEEVISQLEDLASQCDDVIDSDVTFPGMY